MFWTLHGDGGQHGCLNERHVGVCGPDLIWSIARSNCWDLPVKALGCYPPPPPLSSRVMFSTDQRQLMLQHVVCVHMPMPYYATACRLKPCRLVSLMPVASGVCSTYASQTSMDWLNRLVQVLCVTTCEWKTIGTDKRKSVQRLLQHQPKFSSACCKRRSPPTRAKRRQASQRESIHDIHVHMLGCWHMDQHDVLPNADSICHINHAHSIIKV
jgi:hypothetical protein